ncbi:aspartic protease [Lithospermum erythrorhizon]|uniref:Aspartic protease n=1 Tax=Lithospermum erythrorhizon TaxID=34254 RepID=A0AAV3PPM8_LITER
MSTMLNYSWFNVMLKMVLTFLMMVLFVVERSEAFGTFGFDIHHRYSDHVRGILDLDGLPEMGTREYYTVMTQRDKVINGRHLAESVEFTPITFAGGNDTYRINSLGFLHYANVTVGTPGLSFLVALDTGSELFWLPCDCTNCVTGLVTGSGQRIDLNIYSPSTSTTSTKIPCNSSRCRQQRQCSESTDACAYQVSYLSNGTSTTGILVEDILHLTTDDAQLKDVDAQISLGCGIVQTGGFVDGAAPNGLFGLGMTNVSVPSILANKGLATNIFSMCFGPDGVGRMVFGDKSSTDGETSFNIHPLHPTYNVSLAKIDVGRKIIDINFSTIFDSGTSFTYLNDPAYTVITENFNSQVQEARHKADSTIPFDYCYELSANQTSFDTPDLVFTMKGGSKYNVTDPVVIFSLGGGRGYIYCLAVVKSGNVNIFGQNFMTGYRVVFDREKMVLGWKASNCYDAEGSNTLPIGKSPMAAPAPASTSVVPEATAQNNNGAPIPSNPALPIPGEQNSAPDRSPSSCTLLMILSSIYIHYLISLS